MQVDETGECRLQLARVVLRRQSWRCDQRPRRRCPQRRLMQAPAAVQERSEL